MICVKKTYTNNIVQLNRLFKVEVMEKCYPILILEKSYILILINYLLISNNDITISPEWQNYTTKLKLFKFDLDS